MSKVFPVGVCAADQMHDLPSFFFFFFITLEHRVE